MGCLTLPGPRATSCNMRKERLEYVAAMVGPCWRMRMEFLWLVLWFSMLFSKFGRPNSAENLSFSMKLRLLVCLVFETIIYFDCCYLVLVEIVSGWLCIRFLDMFDWIIWPPIFEEVGGKSLGIHGKNELVLGVDTSEVLERLNGVSLLCSDTFGSVFKATSTFTAEPLSNSAVASLRIMPMAFWWPKKWKTRKIGFAA